MAQHQQFVIITGLPGAGKSTVASGLSKILGLPLLDKDKILEQLFVSKGCASAQARQQLSRLADVEFERLAKCNRRAILDSFWRHPSVCSDSGTPSNWLQKASVSVVEVYCQCSPEFAAKRFVSRQRHPGHHDQLRSEQSLVAKGQQLQANYPLNIGSLVTVNMEDDTDIGVIGFAVEQRLK